MTGQRLFLSLIVLLMAGVVQSATVRTGRTYPPQTQRTYNVLLFPVHVPTTRPLYEMIETHLSLADHSVSYLMYEQDFQPDRLPSKDTHLIRTPATLAADDVRRHIVNRSEWERSALTLEGGVAPTIPAAYLWNLSNRCEWLLNDENLMARLQRTNLDLIFVELPGNDVCGLILARKLKVRAVGISATAIAEPFLHYTGNSFVTPMSMITGSTVRDIFSRASNLYSYVKTMIFWEKNYFDNLARIACEQLSDCPTVGELYNHLDIVFTNSDIVTEYPQAVLPNVVPIGGIITKVPQLFPKDMESIARSYHTGIILITLETSLIIVDYPKPFLNVLVNTLAQFKHAIFWKAKNGSVENSPANMFLEEAFSVQDILGHVRTRLVVTTCDTDTVHSAVFHGVPILCIPILEHQVTLARIVESKGLGGMLTLDSFNVESLTRAIQNIISNKTYLENVRRSSELLRDRPDTPSDLLIFWTEFVIRHGGASHLRNQATPFKPSLMQYFLLDVVLVFLAAVLLVVGLWLTTRCYRTLTRKWLKRTSKNGKNKIAQKSKHE